MHGSKPLYTHQLLLLHIRQDPRAQRDDKVQLLYRRKRQRFHVRLDEDGDRGVVRDNELENLDWLFE